LICLCICSPWCRIYRCECPSNSHFRHLLYERWIFYLYRYILRTSCTWDKIRNV